MACESYTYKRRKIVWCVLWGKKEKDTSLESVFTKKEGDAHWCLLKKRGKVMKRRERIMETMKGIHLHWFLVIERFELWC